MDGEMLLRPVGEDEEYPVMGGAPRRFALTQLGYACKICGALTPRMAQWVTKHCEWHAADAVT